MSEIIQPFKISLKATLVMKKITRSYLKRKVFNFLVKIKSEVMTTEYIKSSLPT